MRNISERVLNRRTLLRRVLPAAALWTVAGVGIAADGIRRSSNATDRVADGFSTHPTEDVVRDATKDLAAVKTEAGERVLTGQSVTPAEQVRYDHDIKVLQEGEPFNIALKNDSENTFGQQETAIGALGGVVVGGAIGIVALSAGRQMPKEPKVSQFHPRKART